MALPDGMPALEADRITGPSIRFAGQPARWTGDDTSMSDRVALEARVTFDTVVGRRATAFLDVVNDGTTAIYYDWRKLSLPNPFGVPRPDVQQFYFDNNSGECQAMAV